jgi:hypothetical protein
MIFSKNEAELLGHDPRFWHSPSICGSGPGDVGMQMLPDVRPKSSPDRQHDLKAAVALVAEIEEEERGQRFGDRATAVV